MGGLEDFGPVELEADEPVFHTDWERRAAGLKMAVWFGGHTSGRSRYCTERMDPGWYLVSPYYEHWVTATATELVEAGLITRQELADRLGSAFAVSRPDRAPRLTDPGPSSDRHRYAVGDEVRVRDFHTLGHTRAPRYVRGKRGTVVRLDGVFSLPDVHVHCDRRRDEPTYSVRFEASELWGAAGDPVHVDLWESYLEAAGE